MGSIEPDLFQFEIGYLPLVEAQAAAMAHSYILCHLSKP